jgi:predicted glycosyltransferase
MARYLFASHDGFGLGHVRRNTLVARSILAREPDAEITIVTGVPMRPAWLGDPRLRVVQVPAMLKDTTGAYRHESLSFEQAIEERAEAFWAAVVSSRPNVIVVDRHPYGLAGELKDALDDAAWHGTALVLGLRDVLDQPSAVIEELAGNGWSDVGDRFDEVLVYGDRVLCDHELEYGLPMAPRYCGWVADRSPTQVREPGLVVVTGGGGGDGEAVFQLGADLAHRTDVGRVVVVAGPYAGTIVDDLAGSERSGTKLQVVRNAAGCAEIFAGASAVVQMAGYNSTFESLAAGLRPVLVPRRSPRREQAIRASRLAALGLADVVDEGAPVDEVAWLLQRDRLLAGGALDAAGIRLDGADRAGRAVSELARAAVR